MSEMVMPEWQFYSLLLAVFIWGAYADRLFRTVVAETELETFKSEYRRLWNRVGVLEETLKNKENYGEWIEERHHKNH